LKFFIFGEPSAIFQRESNDRPVAFEPIDTYHQPTAEFRETIYKGLTNADENYDDSKKREAESEEEKIYFLL
jgi:hypothetical protein